MPVPKVYTFKNGAKLIYQKQNYFDGYAFTIGFNSGAQCDGKYEGISHLLEHLFFRSNKTKFGDSLDDNIKYSALDPNAFTTENVIAAHFEVPNKVVAREEDRPVHTMLNTFMSRIMNKVFTKDQIQEEIKTVLREIDIYKAQLERYKPSGIDTFLDQIYKSDPPMSPLEVLGTQKTLNSITPELLAKYVDRYFCKENLVISVTTNDSLENVVKLIQTDIFPKVPRAKLTNYIMPLPELPEFHDDNISVVRPTQMSTVSLKLLFKERSTFSQDINKEKAVDTIEEYIMNNVKSGLWKIFRDGKSPSYLFSMSHMDLGATKFKNFNIITNASQLNPSLNSLCAFLLNVAQNGVPEEEFNAIKEKFLSEENAYIQKFESVSAEENFTRYLSGKPFVDYDKVMDYIVNMTCQEFNDIIYQTYATANVSMIVEGDFLANKVPNLIQIEKKLGNYSHADIEKSLNVGRIEKVKSRKTLVREIPMVLEVPIPLALDEEPEDLEGNNAEIAPGMVAVVENLQDEEVDDTDDTEYVEGEGEQDEQLAIIIDGNIDNDGM